MHTYRWGAAVRGAVFSRPRRPLEQPAFAAVDNQDNQMSAERMPRGLRQRGLQPRHWGSLCTPRGTNSAGATAGTRGVSRRGAGRRRRP